MKYHPSRLLVKMCVYQSGAFDDNRDMPRITACGAWGAFCRPIHNIAQQVAVVGQIGSAILSVEIRRDKDNPPAFLRIAFTLPAVPHDQPGYIGPGYAHPGFFRGINRELRNKSKQHLCTGINSQPPEQTAQPVGRERRARRP